jgi:hypothetical protein
MATYTVPDLAKRGARYAFQLLLQHVRDGDEPFVTYGAIARLLEEKLRIPKVFPTHIGWVAGEMMDRIEKVDPDAPLINALVTRPTGIPGRGFGGYYDRLLRPSGGRAWESLGGRRKLAVVEDVRRAVRNYPDWDAIYRAIYGANPPRAVRPKKFTEKDGKPPETARAPGAGESAEHRRLKAWAAENPQALGLARAMKGTPEKGLLSGDRIDVLFTDGTSFVAVEVKSIRSSEDDWQRGLYQCVKYRAVLEAQELPVATEVRAMLLTEKRLTPELEARARALDVMVKVHALNPSI